MPRCPDCSATMPDEGRRCPECGAIIRMDEGNIPEWMKGADVDHEREQEWFERRFGIDIGERTVVEYLNYLERQNFARTNWFWLFVGAELVGVALFVVNLWGPSVPLTWLWSGYVAVSLLLAAGIFCDTRFVGQFRRRSTTRWLYVVLAALPLVGHVTGMLYTLYRRLKHEETTEVRRRLLDAGFDLETGPRRSS